MTQIINPYRFGGVSTDLLTDLVSYWKLDEASGNALDAHGSNDLTPSATAASVTGIINNARNVSSADFSRADNASLSMGDIDFTIQAWVYRTGSLAFNKAIVGKWDTTGNKREYLCFINTSNEIEFVVSNDGIASTKVSASTFGAVPLSTWVHVLCYHDATSNEIGVEINGTTDTTAHTTGVFDGTSVFYLSNFNAASNYFPGYIDEVAIWKRLLTPAEKSAVYNSGSGLSYDSF